MDLIADEYYRVGMILGADFENVLERIQQVREFAVSFFERYAIKIHLTEIVEVAILAGSTAEDSTLKGYLNRLDHVLKPGVKLVRDRIGQYDFLLSEEVVSDNEAFL
ncbi:hypothetical protein DFAR_3980005 [Desulfarculales bacterium]